MSVKRYCTVFGIHAYRPCLGIVVVIVGCCLATKYLNLINVGWKGEQVIDRCDRGCDSGLLGIASNYSPDGTAFTLLAHVGLSGSCWSVWLMLVCLAHVSSSGSC